MALHNHARMTTATVGTGTLTVGVAVAGFLTFPAAGVVDGETVSYALIDGLNVEMGHGVWSAAAGTLTRPSPLSSTNSGSQIFLSGSAQVVLTVLAQDVITPAILAGGTLPIVSTSAYSTPTTGFSITLSTQKTTLNPAGTLATGTIVMPAGPTEGQTVSVTSTQQVTALTVNTTDGSGVVCAPTFLSPGTPATMIYHATPNAWFPA